MWKYYLTQIQWYNFCQTENLLYETIIGQNFQSLNLDLRTVLYREQARIRPSASGPTEPGHQKLVGHQFSMCLAHIHYPGDRSPCRTYTLVHIDWYSERRRSRVAETTPGLQVCRAAATELLNRGRDLAFQQLVAGPVRTTLEATSHSQEETKANKPTSEIAGMWMWWQAALFFPCKLESIGKRFTYKIKFVVS
jgi:hypothetical protein